MLVALTSFALVCAITTGLGGCGIGVAAGIGVGSIPGCAVGAAVGVVGGGILGSAIFCN